MARSGHCTWMVMSSPGKVVSAPLLGEFRGWISFLLRVEVGLDDLCTASHLESVLA